MANARTTRRRTARRNGTPRGARREMERPRGALRRRSVGLKDADGRMHAWGDGWRGVASVDREWSPASAPAHCPRVTFVACGAYHAAAVAEDGGVWTWGEGAFGALGHGVDAGRASTPTPRRVAGLSGRRALSVSCGVWHTAAVALASSDASVGSDPGGCLWTWGDADGGKLGLGDVAASADAPTMVAATPEGAVDFRSVSCGQWHTLALDADGGVWVCGSVGKASGAASTTPTRVAFPERIHHLASGDAHAAATAENGAGLYVGCRSKRRARTRRDGGRIRAETRATTRRSRRLPRDVRPGIHRRRGIPENHDATRKGGVGKGADAIQIGAGEVGGVGKAEGERPRRRRAPRRRSRRRGHTREKIFSRRRRPRPETRHDTRRRERPS